VFNATLRRSVVNLPVLNSASKILVKLVAQRPATPRRSVPGAGPGHGRTGRNGAGREASEAT